jgi:hypothetical protein
VDDLYQHLNFYRVMYDTLHPPIDRPWVPVGCLKAHPHFDTDSESLEYLSELAYREWGAPHRKKSKDGTTVNM